MDLLDISVPPIDRSQNPLVLPWPVSGNLGGSRIFSTLSEWREFILNLRLHEAIPKVVSCKFLRAQKLYFLAWADFDVIKAGELMALTALELALKDRYGKKMLAALLQHMVEKTVSKTRKFQCSKNMVGALWRTSMRQTRRAKHGRARP